MNWKGKVNKVSDREWGDKMIYSWQLDGTNQWFRADENPGIVVGDVIEFEGESAQKVSTKTITQITEEDLKTAVQSQTSNPQEAPPTSSPDFWRWKQMQELNNVARFNWRDARADATRLVCAALEHKVLALGQSQGKKLGILKALINETTRDMIQEMEDGTRQADN